MERLAWIDRVRGLAVVVMMLDHCLAAVAPVAGDAGLWVRLTVTRTALPMFMLVSGCLWALRESGPSLQRVSQILLAAGTSSWLGVMVGLHPVEVLTLYTVAWLMRPVIVRYPVWSAVIGFIQTVYVPVGVAGHELGWVVGWLAIGVLAAGSVREEVSRWGAELPEWLEVIGRRPLGWYVGHLAALASGAYVVSVWGSEP